MGCDGAGTASHRQGCLCRFQGRGEGCCSSEIGPQETSSKGMEDNECGSEKGSERGSGSGSCGSRTDVKAAAKLFTSSSLLDLLNLIPSIE